MRRSRERQRNGRTVCLVEVDEAIVGMLVRDGPLRNSVSDLHEIAGAIVRALRQRDQSPCLDRSGVRVGGSVQHTQDPACRAVMYDLDHMGSGDKHLC